MINKKNELGRVPEELGQKDALHVAIVSVRTGETLKPGDRVKMKDGFAVKSNVNDAIGVVDPFRKEDKILLGEDIWILLGLKEVPNVKHVWDHPTESFLPPEKGFLKYPKYFSELCKFHGVEPKVAVKAAFDYLKNGNKTKIPNVQKLEEFEFYDFWSEWAAIVDYEFENYGTYCCPEYDYPEEAPFE